MSRNIEFLISVVDTIMKEKYRVTRNCQTNVVGPRVYSDNYVTDLVYCTRREWYVFSLLKKVKIQVRHCQAVYIINTRPTCGGGGRGVNRKQRTVPCCCHLTVLRRVRGETRLVYLCQSFTPATM